MKNETRTQIAKAAHAMGMIVDHLADGTIRIIGNHVRVEAAFRDAGEVMPGAEVDHFHHAHVTF